MIHVDEGQPTEDELAGMAWWNAMSEAERAEVLYLARTAIVADAWAWHKRQADHVDEAQARDWSARSRPIS